MLENNEFLKKYYNYECKKQILIKNEINERKNTAEIVNYLANVILENEKIITFKDTEELYIWNEAKKLYEPGEAQLKMITQALLDNNSTTHKITETINAIKRKTMKERNLILPPAHLIPLRNGILNAQTKELIEYTHNYFFTSKHNVNYIENPDLFENRIEQFLNEITENQEDALLVKEIIGYCFYRSLPFQNFFILVGGGCNGKSTLLNVIRAMLGEENIASVSLQALCENRFAIANLWNKNANIFGDLPKKAFSDVGLLKQLTGGDLITAEQKFKPSFSFRNHAKIIASCNEIPETPDMSDAFFRRAVIINFPKNFEGKENINLLCELLHQEHLDAFFSSCLDAFFEALADGKLTRTETTTQKKEKYLQYSNSALAYINLFLDYEPDGMIEQEKLYEDYIKFCEKNKLPKIELNQFFNRLYRFFGHKVYKKRERIESYDGKEVRRNWIVGVDFK